MRVWGVSRPAYASSTSSATALAGPVVGIAVGVLTSAVNTLRNPTFWPFVVVQVIVALYAGLAARAGLFRSLKTAVPTGLGLGVIASLTSTPISYFVFGCTTTGGIALTTALGRALGLPPLGACFFGSFVSDFGDKAVTFALVEAMVARGWSLAVAYVFAATLSAVPVLKARARRIVEAQRCRGLSPRGSVANRLRALRALALPLVLSALHEVDERTLALETRGLGAGVPRTPLAAPPDRPAERVARWALLLLCLAALIWRLA